MEPWQDSLRAAIDDPEQLAGRFSLDPAQTAAVAACYPIRLTPSLLAQIDGTDSPLGRQFLPNISELANDDLDADPLSEARLAPLPALVHRYPNRVLLLAANSCAAYCRFCTRKRRVGRRDENLSFGAVLDAIAYIADHPEIDEVIISGGDPLTLSDGLLKELLGRLHAIPHIALLRLATRIPAVLPERITPQLVELLARHQPLFVTTHFNHPDELSVAATAACALLADAGIPLANQTVLLKGVNDDLDTLAALCTGLLRRRIRPYYLHQLDPVHGTGHFRVPVETGIELVAGLRRRVSGLAVPHYIIDTPGGHGKLALTPEAIVAHGPVMRLRTADGQIIDYPNHS
jgi:lysine 2,3-aminomutase